MSGAGRAGPREASDPSMCRNPARELDIVPAAGDPGREGSVAVALVSEPVSRAPYGLPWRVVSCSRLRVLLGDRESPSLPSPLPRGRRPRPVPRHLPAPSQPVLWWVRQAMAAYRPELGL